MKGTQATTKDQNDALSGAFKSKFTPATLVIILFLGLGLLLMFARLSPGFANFYTENIYPLWQGSLGRISGLFTFSLSELILYSLPILIIIDCIINRKRIRKVFKHLAILASLLFFLYQANCGVNYYSTSFVEKEGITLIGDLSTDENMGSETSELLVDFCEFAVNGINETGGEYPRGTDLNEEAKTAMTNLGEIYPSLSGYYPLPKAIIVSRPFTNMEVTGIYSPFTIEANYNREIPGYDLPYTACHELSHLRGFMDEGEANFIGWLACLNSENQGFKRSAYMMAWVYGGNQLLKTDPETHKMLRSKLPEDAIKEFQDAREFWAKYKTSASEVQDKVNDAYLKSNGLEEGIKSYDNVLIMMLSWYKSL